ncbi:kinase-like domain-containing protein [Terfezia claveryi]|nr:kinase-like domain-containing protein [Terfezia claveryi]
MECMREKFSEGLLLDGRYLTLSPLNQGSFGLVSLAKDIITEELVAVKCLTKPAAVSSVDGYFADDLTVEFQYHSRLGLHPNIVNLIHHFETESHLFIVLEFCPNGDLYEAIRLGRGPLETEHVREFMLQLVDAVEHMHTRGIYHRDIKPENIFLTQNGSMKLGDFGLATTDEWSEESSVGSDRYMSPEQYMGGYSPEKADIWAIGICLLNVLFARNPFVTPTLDDLLFADFVRDRETLFDIFPTLSCDAYDVLVHCLALDPEERSLQNVREAIERVSSFTTEDDLLDDFCTEDKEVGAAPANREPLRTPSIQTPQITQSGYFQWAQALQMTPQKDQLSVVYDEDEGISDMSEESSLSDGEYVREMSFYVPAPASYDSALGASFSSVAMKSSGFSNMRSENIPITNGNKTSTISLAKEDHHVSTSWSDWIDEDEEVEEREREEARKRLSWSYEAVGAAEDFGDDVEWIGGWEEDVVAM